MTLFYLKNAYLIFRLEGRGWQQYDFRVGPFEFSAPLSAEASNKGGGGLAKKCVCGKELSTFCRKTEQLIENSPKIRFLVHVKIMLHIQTN